ncbi:carboxypeptidase-like regulatory domain-containing protein [Nocardioides sp. 503]|uniref:carboxypeptidase-like regulatory domain-containing protein n=1 Tax=Nocardioides sp. 503 TaxID=2508326 RepID=UPI00106F4BD8|nr:carboxypeptidase-like regulatory domain-containing protein [Nocardioides sp. 503]
MPSPSRSRDHALIAVVLTAIVACLALVMPAQSALAGDGSGAGTSGGVTSAKVSVGKVRGNVLGRASDGRLRLKMLLFRADWSYIGARRIAGSTYSLTLPAGTYRLQFVDKRPSYDVRKYAPTDVLVRVRAGSTTVRNARMRRGAAITGVVRTGGKPGAGAKVVAANTSEQSFDTVANAQGQFAIGGLPAGNYSIFTYDRRRTWVGKSLYAPRVKAGKFRNVRINLRKRAGELRVDLYAGGQPLTGSGFATVVSRKTGQFWTAKFSRGSIAFPGVYPGRYRIIMPDAGRWFGRSGNVSNGYVRPGRGAFGSFALTQRGGALTGRVLRDDSGTAFQGVTLRLYNRAGALIAQTTSSTNGGFYLGGNLRSQVGMTLVAYNSFDGNYKQLTVPNLSVRINQDVRLPNLRLQRNATTTPSSTPPTTPTSTATSTPTSTPTSPSATAPTSTSTATATTTVTVTTTVSP